MRRAACALCYDPRVMASSLSSTITVAPVETIRAHVPALRRRHDGQPVAYFDGPGGTQVPQAVVDAMADYLLHHNANTHWVYPSSVETDALIERSRAALADYLNASPNEIVFGQNMTTLTFHLGRALARGWTAGDEIVVTELDHHANADPWRAAARERGLVVRTVPFDPGTGELIWEALREAITPRTRLLAIGAASNALGTISDVTAAAALAHAAGALCFVDAVHYAAHELVDVRAIDCDFLACSPYKFYGPHAGVLYGRHALLAALDVPKLEPASDHAPDRLETGTLSHEAIAGSAAAVDWLASLAPGAGSRREALAATFAALHARGLAQVTRLWEGLRAIPGVTVYGPPPSRPRTSTISFVVAGRSADEVARHCAAAGLFVSSGDFYALTVIRRLGHEHDGLVRLGCAAYTTGDEVERVLAAVRALGAR
jgi:cysteine desulfurase family protein (TIGR01976 family)